MYVCGFFGKLPSRGDFIDRLLPPRITERLDRWLEDTLLICMEQDEGWEIQFEHSPCWHFAIGLEGQPAGLVGVLLPSRDRVGRSFPLVLARPLETAPGLNFPSDWSPAYEQLARLARQAVETPLTPEALEQQLSTLAPPPTHSGKPIPAMQPGLRLNLSGGNLSRTLAAFPSRSGLHKGSLWWHHGNDERQPCVLVSKGFPPPRAACALWNGDLHDSAWRRVGR